MATSTDQIRLILAAGPRGAAAIAKKAGLSQPTLSRAIAAMGSDVVRIRTARSIQYALRDNTRGLGDMPVYRVGTDGRIQHLGVLTPVRDDGFVMQQADGTTLHSAGIPWWLLDMRPQGFMGRAYASRHAQSLGLPASISEWSDTHALRALLAHGHDAVGSLLIGNIARDRFIHAPDPTPIAHAEKAQTYVRLANEAAGTADTWSSAAGEQPKFAAFAETAHGARHLIVKFTVPDDNPVSQRWRDLLLAEHHALQTLNAGGVPAAQSAVGDENGQRFLEVARFDRVGDRGRCGLFSLAALDAEFTGKAPAPWPVQTAALLAGKHITVAAHQGAALLYAFGTLIGNTDMHPGNLSFISTQGNPYANDLELAPAYDMLPMGFQPRASGALTDTLQSASLHASVAPVVWVRALDLAQTYLQNLRTETRFSAAFAPCLQSLEAHIADAAAKVNRLAIE